MRNVVAIVSSLLLAAPATLAQGSDSATVMLRMRNGGILWGEIETHDPESLSFRRLDNGGLARLPWTVLDPGEERALRTRFGYVDVTAEEILVDADKLKLSNGKEIVGLIVKRDDENLWIKTVERTLPVPKTAIDGPAGTVKVPALDLYTKEQIYQKRVLEVADALEAGDAAAHFELARYCERFYDFVHAAEHYALCAELDPTHEADTVRASLPRTQAKAALQEQVDALGEIDRWRAKKQFAKAIELLNLFPATYPDSPLMEDWAKLRDRIDKYQLRELREQVVRRFHYWTDRYARDGARLGSFEAAMGYLEEAMEQNVLESVTNDLRSLAAAIEPDEVRRLWEEREGGRVKQASYGLGTWLLGEGDALRQYDDKGKGKEEDGASGGQKKSDELAKLQEKIERYLKNQELARQSKTGAQSEDEDPEEFWAQWNYAGRRAWVKAWFVEYSGLFRVEKARFTPCQSCGGKGVREVIFTGGAISGSKSGAGLVPCPTCHQIGNVRRIRYR